LASLVHRPLLAHILREGVHKPPRLWFHQPSGVCPLLRSEEAAKQAAVPLYHPFQDQLHNWRCDGLPHGPRVLELSGFKSTMHVVRILALVHHYWNVMWTKWFDVAHHSPTRLATRRSAAERLAPFMRRRAQIPVSLAQVAGVVPEDLFQT